MATHAVVAATTVVIAMTTTVADDATDLEDDGEATIAGLGERFEWCCVWMGEDGEDEGRLNFLRGGCRSIGFLRTEGS
jgi:hypothetical protein